MMIEDLKEVRTRRNKALALRYVDLNEGRNAIKQIQNETGVNNRAIYRAVHDHLEWARQEHRRLQVESPTLLSEEAS